MHRIVKMIVGLVVGAICGALLGAVMLAVPTYFENGSPPFGGKGWVIVGVYMGVVLGGVPGAVIGFAISISSLNQTKGATLGALVGAIVMVVLFFMGAASEPLVSAWAVLSVPAGALVGLIAATFVAWLTRSEKPKSLPA